MREQYHPEPQNKQRALSAITTLVSIMTARDGQVETPRFSTLLIGSWGKLDKTQPVFQDPDALIIIQGGTNSEILTIAGTLVVNGGMNEGVIHAGRVIYTSDSFETFGGKQVGVTYAQKGKLLVTEPDDRLLLEEACFAALPTLSIGEAPAKEGFSSRGKKESELKESLPSGAEMVRLAEEFLQQQREEQ